jgi:hypothetical protein
VCRSVDGSRPWEWLEAPKQALHSVQTVQLHSHIIHQRSSGLKQHIVVSTDSREALR